MCFRPSLLSMILETVNSLGLVCILKRSSQLDELRGFTMVQMVEKYDNASSLNWAQSWVYSDFSIRMSLLVFFPHLYETEMISHQWSVHQCLIRMITFRLAPKMKMRFNTWSACVLLFFPMFNLTRQLDNYYSTVAICFIAKL